MQQRLSPALPPTRASLSNPPSQAERVATMLPRLDSSQTRSSSREVRIRVPTFFCSLKQGREGHLVGIAALASKLTVPTQPTYRFYAAAFGPVPMRTARKKPEACWYLSIHASSKLSPLGLTSVRRISDVFLWVWGLYGFGYSGWRRCRLIGK